jgi:hypothetical protein
VGAIPFSLYIAAALVSRILFCSAYDYENKREEERKPTRIIAVAAAAAAGMHERERK